MHWFSHRRSRAPRTAADKTARKPPSTCTAVTPSPSGGHTMELSAATCSVRPTAHVSPYHALSVRMTQQLLFFCPWWPWPLTLTFELTAKFHHPVFNLSEVIVHTNKRTNWQTNRRRWKHPPRFATRRRWVINNAYAWRKRTASEMAMSLLYEQSSADPSRKESGRSGGSGRSIGKKVKWSIAARVLICFPAPIQSYLC